MLQSIYLLKLLQILSALPSDTIPHNLKVFTSQWLQLWACDLWVLETANLLSAQLGYISPYSLQVVVVMWLSSSQENLSRNNIWFKKPMFYSLLSLSGLMQAKTSALEVVCWRGQGMKWKHIQILSYKPLRNIHWSRLYVSKKLNPFTFEAVCQQANYFTTVYIKLLICKMIWWF